MFLLLMIPLQKFSVKAFGQITLSVVEFAFMPLQYVGGVVWVKKKKKLSEVYSKKLTQANLYYSSRHKRDNYWCGWQDRERRRMIAEEKGEGVR